MSPLSADFLTEEFSQIVKLEVRRVLVRARNSIAFCSSTVAGTYDRSHLCNRLMKTPSDLCGLFSNVVEIPCSRISFVPALQVLMWFLAIVWLLFPDGSYAGLWVTGIFLFLSLSAGAKVHVIAMNLARCSSIMPRSCLHLHNRRHQSQSIVCSVYLEWSLKELTLFE
jgi:hypothetical protein